MWWAAVLQVAAYWLLSDDTAAERLYSRVESPPHSSASEPLVAAILAGYKARKALLGRNDSQLVLSICHAASQQLQQSLTVDACHKPDTKVLVSIIYLIQLF